MRYHEGQILAKETTNRRRFTVHILEGIFDWILLRRGYSRSFSAVRSGIMRDGYSPRRQPTGDDLFVHILKCIFDWIFLRRGYSRSFSAVSSGIMRDGYSPKRQPTAADSWFSVSPTCTTNNINKISSSFSEKNRLREAAKKVLF